MSDFPRGWTLTNQSTGTASITVAGIAGIIHVLDQFFAGAMIAAGATAFAQTVTLTSSDGVFAAFPLGQVAMEGVLGASGSDSASGLDLAAGPGASLTIAFGGAGAATTFQLLRIQGHDI